MTSRPKWFSMHLRWIGLVFIAVAGADAVFPQPDPRFSEDRFDARLQDACTGWMNKLERQAESNLQPGWEPGDDWWGSISVKRPEIEE